MYIRVIFNLNPSNGFDFWWHTKQLFVSLTFNRFVNAMTHYMLLLACAVMLGNCHSASCLTKL